MYVTFNSKYNRFRISKSSCQTTGALQTRRLNTRTECLEMHNTHKPSHLHRMN
jgi:hypothetical protein